MPQRKSQALITTLLVVSAFIGSADALGPQNLPVSVVTSAVPAEAIASPLLTTIEIGDGGSISNKETTSSLLPSRAPHEGVSTNLFTGHSWYTAPPPVVAPIQDRTRPKRRAPVAPALPFTYIGRFEQEGAATLYYLVQGDRVYDVKIGDEIDGMYSVDGVTNGQLMFTYLPLSSSQGLRLGD